MLYRPTVLSLALAALPLAACGSLSRAAATPAHMVAHQTCSAAFVSGVNTDRYYEQAVAPLAQPLRPFLKHSIDRRKREATASFAGVESRAVYRGDTGCVVVQGPLPPAPSDPGPRAPSLMPAIAGPEVVAAADPALTAAVDRAFAETPKPPHRATKAIVIVKDGRVIAERYAEGYGPQTPLHGWSMSKSATNALLGVLVRQGRLDMTAPAGVAAWSAPGDPRRAITPDQLLRMTSGLVLGDSLNANWKSMFDPAAQMLFATPDMAKAMETARLATPPGSRFTYSDASTLLLSRVLKDKVGGTGEAVLTFSRRELFDRLGMEHVVFEQDAAGTPIGAAGMYATARDWARLGILFANDGVVGGERLLPEGWVDYSARLTPGSEYIGYGAGFWTNRGRSNGATKRSQMPADSFMAKGTSGQYTIIIPSRRIVIVKLGDALTPRGDIAPMNRLVAEVVTATGG